MPKKTLILTNYEGHQYDPTLTSGWSDTWVKFHNRRKRVELGPTILTLPDVLKDNEWCREFAESDPEHAQHHLDSIADLPNHDDWEFHVPFDDGWTDDIPNIIVNAEWIDKASIERAIGWYLSKRYGFTTEMRYRWAKNKRKSFVRTVSFA